MGRSAPPPPPILTTPCVQGAGNALSTQGVFASLNESYSPSDLKLFQMQFKLGIQPVAAPYGHANGNVVCPKHPEQCTESMLDLQYMMALSSTVASCASCTTNCGTCGSTSKSRYGAHFGLDPGRGVLAHPGTPTSPTRLPHPAILSSPTTYWYVDQAQSRNHDLFVYWLIQVANSTQIPWVLSVSYGGPEHYISNSELDTFNSVMIKLGAIGVTVLVASGDNGAPNDDAVGNPGECGYWPDFPAANPYVLSVGATQGLEQSYKRERACQSDTNGLITTGGGFSNHYARPSWQTKAVTNYLRLRAPTMAPTAASANAGANFNSLGRGYPDLSVAGFQYITVVGGAVSFVAGTSASAPVVAGMLSLVNAARLARGYPTVGFVNPALYANNFTVGFNDVLDGKNNCVQPDGDGNVVCCSQGFTGAPGWDPVTGAFPSPILYFMSATDKGAPCSSRTCPPSSPPRCPVPPAATGFGSLNFTSFLTYMMSTVNGKSNRPTYLPTAAPNPPSVAPTGGPVRKPTFFPSMKPTVSPTRAPTTFKPTFSPSRVPSTVPTRMPTRVPSSSNPTTQPSAQPSRQPAGRPTGCPSGRPTMRPSRQPTRQPTGQPSRQPTRQPTRQPSRQPSSQPTLQPINRPTSQPSRQPTSQPSRRPTRQPTSRPTRVPMARPTSQPSRQPTSQPTHEPTRQPTSQPTREPTSQPTGQPSRQPTSQPTHEPTRQPTGRPSREPTSQPTRQPSRQPLSRPTGAGSGPH